MGVSVLEKEWMRRNLTRLSIDSQLFSCTGLELCVYINLYIRSFMCNIVWGHNCLCSVAVGPPLLFPVYFQFMLFRHIFKRKLWLVRPTYSGYQSEQNSYGGFLAADHTASSVSQNITVNIHWKLSVADMLLLFFHKRKHSNRAKFVQRCGSLFETRLPCERERGRDSFWAKLLK